MLLKINYMSTLPDCPEVHAAQYRILTAAELGTTTPRWAPGSSWFLTASLQRRVDRAGRTINTSTNFSHATKLESSRCTVRCYWWAVEMTSSLQNLPVARSFSGFAVRADESSVMYIRVLDTIPSSTAPLEISWTGSQLVLQGDRRQPIVPQNKPCYAFHLSACGLMTKLSPLWSAPPVHRAQQAGSRLQTGSSRRARTSAHR